MSQFLINASPVLRKMSHHNETVSLLKNQIWLLIDDKGHDERLVFHENGEADSDKKDVKSKYKWEFTGVTNQLKITKTEVVTYQILYIDKQVVVLQNSSTKPEFTYLANTKYLTILEVDNYVHNAVAKHLKLTLMHVTDGFDIEIHRSHAEEAIGTKGQQVTKDLEPLADGMYKSSTSNFFYEIQDSRISRKNHYFKITLANGVTAGLYTENKTAFITAGDKIVIDEKPLEDGKHFTSDLWFVITNGKVSHTGTLKKFKTGKGMVTVELNDVNPASGDIAYTEDGSPYDGDLSLGMFKKIKVSGGKVV